MNTNSAASAVYEEHMEQDYEIVVESEPLTETHIDVRSRPVDVSDFLEEEKRRAQQRDGWITALLKDKTDRQVSHAKAIAEQVQLEENAQAKIDEQLLALGHNPITVETNVVSTYNQALPARRGRKPGSTNKPKDLVGSVSHGLAGAPFSPAEPKRVLSAAHLAAMAAGRTKAAAKRKKAAKAAAKDK